MKEGTEKENVNQKSTDNRSPRKTLVEQQAETKLAEIGRGRNALTESVSTSQKFNPKEDIKALPEKELAHRLKILLDHLAPEDVERAAAYGHDLGRGLVLLRTIPQGVTIFGSARVREGDKYYEKARELGGLLAQNGHAVVTGGGPGIMEAANRGAFEYGGRSVGLNITLEHEQFANRYLTDILEFEYFFARKVTLTMASKVFVYFPGGFGTLDEFSEILCLMQENKMPRMPMFLYGKSYWKGLDRYFASKFLKAGMIQRADLNIYKITDDLSEIVRAANKMGHPRVQENLYDQFQPGKRPSN